MTPKVVVLHGDQTGEELLLESIRILDPAVIGVEIDLEHFDLSLANRRATQNAVVNEAADAMLTSGLGLKAATVTPHTKDDIGSPNALLRQRVGGKVIVRTGRRIPGVASIGGVNAPVSVVRMAVDEAYNAKEWREGQDGSEVAYRTEHISRDTCRAVAEYAFTHAQRIGASVFGGPKFTVSRVFEGMFKEELDAAAAKHPDVRYDPQLIDATYALLMTHDGEPLVIPTLNRDGDCMSDLVLQMFGSIAGAESVLLSFNSDLQPSVVMAEAPHGTAPGLEGKNLANPMAMFLACAALLGYVEDGHYRLAGEAIRRSVFDVVRSGTKTVDLGGDASMTEFGDAVVKATRAALAGSL